MPLCHLLRGRHNAGMGDSKQSAWKEFAAIVPSLWRWGGWIPGILLLAFGRELTLAKGIGTVATVLLVALGKSLMVVAFGLLLMWAGGFIWLICSPARRLHKLDAQIRAARQSFYSANGYFLGGMKAKNSSSVRHLIRDLDKLKIPRPTLNSEGLVWDHFLSRLLGEARASTLDKAKEIWAEMEQEREDD